MPYLKPKSLYEFILKKRLYKNAFLAQNCWFNDFSVKVNYKNRNRTKEAKNLPKMIDIRVSRIIITVVAIEQVYL